LQKIREAIIEIGISH